MRYDWLYDLCLIAVGIFFGLFLADFGVPVP